MVELRVDIVRVERVGDLLTAMWDLRFGVRELGCFIDTFRSRFGEEIDEEFVCGLLAGGYAWSTYSTTT